MKAERVREVSGDVTLNDAILSTGDLSELSGVPIRQIGSLVSAGILTPAAGGGGMGNHRRWTPMQAIGLAVAAEIQKGTQGCHLKYVGEVVESFTNITETELLAMIEDRGRAFVKPHNGRPILQGRDFDEWPDVQSIHRRVTKNIRRLARRPANAVGRNRGLVGATG